MNVVWEEAKSGSKNGGGVHEGMKEEGGRRKKKVKK